MSRIESWDDATKSRFLAWIGKTKSEVRFLAPPRVDVVVRGSGGREELLEYVAECSGDTFVLRDLNDHAGAIEKDDDELPENYTEHVDPAQKDRWTAWRNEPSKTTGERLADFLSEYVSSDIRSDALAQLERIVWEISRLDSSRFIAAVLGSDNPLLTVWAWAFAFNLPIVKGRSQTDIARRCGFTRAALSKTVKKWQGLSGRVPSRYVRSEAATVTYSEREKLKQ